MSLDINPVLSDNESSIDATFTEDESDSVSEGIRHFYCKSFSVAIASIHNSEWIKYWSRSNFIEVFR